MISLSKYILKLLSAKEKRQLSYMFVAVLCAAIVEVAGVASIMPFMSLVVDPSIIGRSPYLNKFYTMYGFGDYKSFLIMVGVAVILLIVFSNLLIAATQWWLIRFSWMRNHSISTRVLAGYLDKEYSYFLKSRLTDLEKNIVQEVYIITQNILMPLLTVASRSLISLAIISILIILDPLLSLSIAAVIGGLYLTLYLCTRNKAQSYSKGMVKAESDRFKILEEAFGALKFIKLSGREQNLIDEYSDASRLYSANCTGVCILSYIPRYVMEALAFTGIITIVLYLVVVKDNMQQAISFIAVYAFAGYRLMPLLQQIFAGVTEINGHKESLEVIRRDLGDEVDKAAIFRQKKRSGEGRELGGDIVIRDADFSYGTPEPLIKNLNLKICSCESVGFVGESGAGKTTVAALIMGLLPLSRGSLTVGGLEITDRNLRDWQQRIGLVPQDIYLANDTIYNNIALGILDKDIDERAVYNAVELADLAEWVATLPCGLQTHIGDRGIRISGGQRQKIAIARALYSDPDLLVLDEATSSMDSITENVIIDAIKRIKGKKTVITIAHRITTVKDSDVIYVFEKGENIVRGTYNQLIEMSEKFRMLANTDKTG